MAQSERSTTWDVVARWTIRVLTVIGIIDSWAFKSGSGSDWDPILTFLVVLGVIGAILAWLSTRLPGKEWVWLSVGALMNAAAPAVFYPANGLLVIAGIAVLIVGVIRLGNSPAAA